METAQFIESLQATLPEGFVVQSPLPLEGRTLNKLAITFPEPEGGRDVQGQQANAIAETLNAAVGANTFITDEQHFFKLRGSVSETAVTPHGTIRSENLEDFFAAIASVKEQLLAITRGEKPARASAGRFINSEPGRGRD